MIYRVLYFLINRYTRNFLVICISTYYRQPFPQGGINRQPSTVNHKPPTKDEAEEQEHLVVAEVVAHAYLVHKRP